MNNLIFKLLCAGFSESEATSKKLLLRVINWIKIYYLITIVAGQYEATYAYS